MKLPVARPASRVCEGRAADPTIAMHACTLQAEVLLQPEITQKKFKCGIKFLWKVLRADRQLLHPLLILLLDKYRSRLK